MGHDVGLVEDDELAPAWGEYDLVHGIALDFVPHHVDPARVAGVEFEDARGVRFPKQLAGDGLQNHDRDVLVLAGSTTGHGEVIGARQQSAGDW